MLSEPDFHSSRDSGPGGAPAGAGRSPQRMHRALAAAAVEALHDILSRGLVAERVLEQAFRSHPQWGKRDRGFLARTVFELVRWRRRLEFLAESDDLRILAGLHWTQAGYVRPDWAFWPEFPPETLRNRESLLAAAPRTVRESVPDWLDALGAQECGADRWEAELAAMNRPAPVFLRVNSLMAKPEAVRERLEAEGIIAEEVPGVPGAWQLTGNQRIQARQLQTGIFEIQDAGSQLVAPFLRVEPGMKVIDACAGAGGKTLHLAALMEGNGEIRAFDVSSRKLQNLEKRAQTAGAGRMIRASVISDALVEQHRGWADRLLIDAPCSGLGTLRRQPDLKWRLSPESLERTQDLQRDLLMKYAPMLAPGGLLVYATCSILPGENERQTEWFLTQQQGAFECVESRAVSPAASGFDGFYMALMRRINP